MNNARAIAETLIQEGMSAKAHFQTWWALRNLAIPTYHKTMSDFAHVDFFHASNAAHYKLFLLALAKIFDRDTRVSGLSSFRKALRHEGNAHLADNLERALSPHSDLVERLMSIRNKAIVHNEIGISREKLYEVNGVTPNEIRALIDITCSTINEAARALGISSIIFESNRHESAVLAMLQTLQRGMA